MIGDKPATKPPVVIDSLEDSNVAAATASVQLVDAEEELQCTGKESSDCSSSLGVVENEPKSASKHSDTPVKSRLATPIPEKKGNCKCPLCEDKIEKMMGPLVAR